LPGANKASLLAAKVPAAGSPSRSSMRANDNRPIPLNTTTPETSNVRGIAEPSTSTVKVATSFWPCDGTTRGSAMACLLERREAQHHARRELSEIGEAVHRRDLQVVRGVAVDLVGELKQRVPVLHDARVGDVGGGAVLLRHAQGIFDVPLEARRGRGADRRAVGAEQAVLEVQLDEHALEE